MILNKETLVKACISKQNWKTNEMSVLKEKIYQVHETYPECSVLLSVLKIKSVYSTNK